MASELFWLAMLGVGVIGAILSGMPVMVAVAGAPLAVAVLAWFAGSFDPSFLLAYPNRVFGVMNNAILIAVPLFVMMGVLLEQSRIAERMLVNLTRALGGSSSVLTVCVLLVSALLAASTGVIGATIVMLGMIALPALLKSGISVGLSSGLICASGTLGQIIPPSIVLILLGDQISNAHIEAQRNLGNFAPDPVTVGDLFAGALLPGLVLVALYAIYAVLTIRLRGAGDNSYGGVKPAVTERSESGVVRLIGDTAMPILLVVAVLGSILAGVATPTEAAAIGVAATLLMTAWSQKGLGSGLRRILPPAGVAAFGLVALKAAGMSHPGGLSTPDTGTWLTVMATLVVAMGLLSAAVILWRCGLLRMAMTRTIEISAMIFGIVLAASMLSLIFRGFKGDTLVADLLNQVPGDKWGMLCVTMAVIFLLGFVLEFIEIVLIVIPIVGPILLATDFDPVWLAILVALNLQTSFLTPPFGFALFYYRSVAPPEISTATIYKSIAPFVIIQLIAIGIVAVFPWLATWLPSILFD